MKLRSHKLNTSSKTVQAPATTQLFPGCQIREDLRPPATARTHEPHVYMCFCGRAGACVYLGPLQNSYSLPRLEKTMSATSASQSTESSYAFLRRPLRRLQKVTCLLVVFSMRLISVLPLPLPPLFLSAADPATDAEPPPGDMGSFSFCCPAEVRVDCTQENHAQELLGDDNDTERWICSKLKKPMGRTRNHHDACYCGWCSLLFSDVHALVPIS